MGEDGVKESRTFALCRSSRFTVSLSAVPEDAAIAAGPDDEAGADKARRLLDWTLPLLRPRERMILEARYGFDGVPMTLRELGEQYGVTPQRIREIAIGAMVRLKKRIIVLEQEKAEDRTGV